MKAKERHTLLLDGNTERGVCVPALGVFFVKRQIRGIKGKQREDICNVVPAGHAAAISNHHQKLHFDVMVTLFG